jgi:hypothetical protein
MIIKKETSRLEELTIDEARGLNTGDPGDRRRTAYSNGAERIRRDQEAVRPKDLEDLPVFDLSDQSDWMEDVEGMVRIRAPGRRCRTCTDNLEPLFQNDLLIKTLERTNGDSWLEEHLGIPGSTSRRWRTKHIRHPDWRPWCNPRKGTSLKFTERDVELIRQHLFRHP